MRTTESNAPSASASACTVAWILGEVEGVLRGAGLVQAREEARDLVAALCDESRFWPTLNKGVVISSDLADRCLHAARRRAAGAPFAYAVGRAAFRHLQLTVDERVLIPRQETEQLVELVLERTRAMPGGAACDVGTGSGAIALALASEGRFDRIIATDVSHSAIMVATENLRRMEREGMMTAPVELVCCDLVSGVKERGLRAVVSNPPYIAFDEAPSLPSSVRDWEPSEALYSNRNGLAVTERLIARSGDLLCSGGLLALEVDERRAAVVAGKVEALGVFTGITVELDLAGRERFVLAIRENG